MCVRLSPRIRCRDLRQWIRCHGFWNEFWKTERADNQSGNSILRAFLDSGIDVKEEGVILNANKETAFCSASLYEGLGNKG